ncbi:hypothetical protein [Streptomyces fragilis]|uniref:LPXTG cell wall anchor domain-containing protein n=1 Tax=Streptomyces fragilis TaxID=67301 RepID=A0ABV2YL46_9ACTN|nr:hypothetical protein [Streptomyces fragilis]
MRVRRALAVAAATAVVAPLALLSAPVAYAEDPAPSASRTPGQGVTATPGTSGEPAASPSPTGSPEVPAPGAAQPGGERPGGDRPGEGGAPGAEDTREEEADDPVLPVCTRSEVVEGLKAKVTGLPRRIGAGAGWDEFRFTVTNDTGRDLDRLWIDLAVTYQENPELLAEGLAEIQYRHDGRWSDDEYHRWPGSTGSYSDKLLDVAAGATFTADLRVRVREDAPAGVSWAYTDVVYDEDLTCYRGRSDLREFTVVAAGTAPPETPRPTPTSTPSATGRPDPADPVDHGGAGDGHGTRPQGGTGSLASTGADSLLLPVAAAGAAAVVLGAGTFLAVHRRRTGSRT